MRLAGALWRFWWVRGHLSEGRGWLDAAQAYPAAPAEARAKVLHGAGNFALPQGDYAGRRPATARRWSFGGRWTTARASRCC